MSSAYHPQTNGQFERTIQSLEDLLITCILDHTVFHVSQLRKYVFDPSHVFEAEDIRIREDLAVEVPPIALEDNIVEERRGKTVNLVKVIWHRMTGDSTWELEEDMTKSHPHLFAR